MKTLVVGAAMAVLLCGASQGPDDGGGRQASANDGDSRSAQDVPVAAELRRIGRALEAQNARRDSEQEDRDLKAQESMAFWAGAVFWAALGQLFLSAVGIWLIYVTFRATRRAADTTELMAKEAARGTDAVIASNDLNLILAANQARAYLSVEASDFVIEVGKPLTARLKIKNVGSTPALNMALYKRLVLREANWVEGEKPPLPTAPRPEGLIFPGDAKRVEVESFPATDVVKPDALAAFEAGEYVMFLRGGVLYDDVFGNEHETEFAFEVSTAQLAANQVAYSSAGNRAR